MAILTHGSLFSGIGGFDLAAEWMGWENVFHCEWNPFGQKVLKHHFSKAISYEDITKTDFTIHANEIDILTGGFPCQPYSTAGKRKGKDDERHLFPQMLRAIKEIKPRWIVGENVRGLTNWNGGMVFHEVYDDLEREGYEVQSFLIPAAGVNAPHQRYRVWFIAFNTNNKGGDSGSGQIQSKDGEISQWDNNAESSDSGFSNVTDTNSIRQQRGEGWNQSEKRTQSNDKQFERCNKFHREDWQNFPTQPPICFRNDGLSAELDGITFPKWRNESIKAAGNAIVPQVALQIFKAIDQYESNHRH